MTFRHRYRLLMMDLSDGRGGRIRKMAGCSGSVAELVEQDLRVKIAKQVHLGIYDSVLTTFKEYAEQWLERKKKKVALSTWRDYRSIMDLYAIPHFGKMPMSRIAVRDVEDFADSLGDLSGKRKNNICVDLTHLKMISVKEGRVQGKEGPPKTDSSYRDIDILPPLLDVLRRHREMSPPDSVYVFTGPKGAPLDVNNLRKRTWYPTLDKCGLRRRTMYQTRHTFASLMLSAGEDPLWVARMLGHTSTEMLYRHYGKYIRNRLRKDGGRFLHGLREAGWETETPAIPAECFTAELRQSREKGLREIPVTL